MIVCLGNLRVGDCWIGALVSHRQWISFGSVMQHGDELIRSWCSVRYTVTPGYHAGWRVRARVTTEVQISIGKDRT